MPFFVRREERTTTRSSTRPRSRTRRTHGLSNPEEEGERADGSDPWSVEEVVPPDPAPATIVSTKAVTAAVVVDASRGLARPSSSLAALRAWVRVESETICSPSFPHDAKLRSS